MSLDQANMRVLPAESREPIVLPTRSDGVDSWLNRVAPAILRLGGDPDRMYAGQVREYLGLLAPSRQGLPEATNVWRKRNFKSAFANLSKIMMHQALGLSYIGGSLFVRAFNDKGDDTLVLSLAGTKLVTDAGVAALTDAFDAGVGFTTENFNFHGIGTGATAPNVTDTAVETELTTQYNPDNLRDAGTQSQPSANVYRSVGTNLVDSAVAITEHGLLDQAAVGGGTLWDRDTFSVINLADGDSLETTYNATFAAGG